MAIIVGQLVSCTNGYINIKTYKSLYTSNKINKDLLDSLPNCNR